MKYLSSQDFYLKFKFNKDYERTILSFELTRTKAIVIGTTTISPPATRLNKKLDKDGVIIFFFPCLYKNLISV